MRNEQNIKAHAVNVHTQQGDQKIKKNQFFKK